MLDEFAMNKTYEVFMPVSSEQGRAWEIGAWMMGHDFKSVYWNGWTLEVEAKEMEL